MTPNIFKIVLTGGPCGGKTTVLSLLKEVLTEKGFTVLTASESASVVFSSDIKFYDLNNEQVLLTQDAIYKLQNTLEDYLLEYSKTLNKPVVILIDRGIMDNKGFITEEQWDLLLKKWNTTEQEIFKRYDFVFHLMTTAKGEEEYYQNKNNPNRTETLQQAKDVDSLLLKIWNNHPNHFIFNNETSFDIKAQNIINKTLTLVLK